MVVLIDGHTGPSPAGCGGRAWCRVLGESALMWWVLSLAHCVCVGCMLPMSLVYASGMPGVCGCMAAGLCAVVTGYVAWCGVWLAGFLAGWVYGSVAGWLSGSPWEGDFGGQISAHFQPQNR